MQNVISVESAIETHISDPHFKMFINGAWRFADSGATFPVMNPATGETLATVPEGGVNETLAAIDSASAALPTWSAMPAQQRSDLMRRVATLMLERREHLATVMTLEQGKPLSESRGEIGYAASFLSWFAGEAERVYGDIVPASVPNKRILVLRQPVGVTAMITPWNFPAAMLTRKLGPALAAGCTVVCKPAEQTPLSALELGKLFEEVGFPAGVVNIVTCHDPVPFSDTIFADERVRKISFTGSTEVGQLLIAKSAATVKRMSMELGGNAPFIVFADADILAAVAGAIASKFRNAGQTCVCANRIYVQRDIYETFSDVFTAEVAKLKVGNGLYPTTTIGPLIDMQARAKVERHISDATAHGAKVLLGGDLWADAENRTETFWNPTVLKGATNDMLVAREETFGPVAPLIAFNEEADVIASANDTAYGLSAYFYTRDMSRVMRVAERLEYGMIGINDGLISTAQAPFGGVKHSGLGREGGSVGIHEYLDVKYLSLGI